jgi:hypothetical protein
VLLRAHFIAGIGTAVLVVFSDFDMEVADDPRVPRAMIETVTVPEEVITMLRSFAPAYERVLVP